MKLYAIKDKGTNRYLEEYYFDKQCNGVVKVGLIDSGNIMTTQYKQITKNIVESLVAGYEVVEIEEIKSYKEITNIHTKENKQ